MYKKGHCDQRNALFLCGTNFVHIKKSFNIKKSHSLPKDSFSNLLNLLLTFSKKSYPLKNKQFLLC